MGIVKKYALVTKKKGGALTKYKSRAAAPIPKYNMLSKIHLFKVNVGYNSLTFDPSQDYTSTGIYFRLTDLPNVSEIATLFDCYKINKIVINVTPTWNQTDKPVNAGSPIIPYIATAIDYNDITPVANLNDLREYYTFKRTQGFRSHRRTIYPKLRVLAYESGGGSGYMQSKPRYISTDDVTVPHYGIKIWMENGGISSSGNPWAARVDATIYFTCKNTK